MYYKYKKGDIWVTRPVYTHLQYVIVSGSVFSRLAREEEKLFYFPGSAKYM